jgi:hypothetical protein
MIHFGRLLQVFIALTTNVVSAQSIPPETADSVLGIRLGVSLEAQMSACPMGPNGVAVPLQDQPCWRVSQLSPKSSVRDVLLPRVLFAELGLVTIRNLREDRGVVVEVEAEFMSNDITRITRYLLQRKGPVAASENYDRQSRVGGTRSSAAHSWYSAESGLHFLEISSSGHSTLRGYNKRWADEENAWREKLRQSGSARSP